MSRLFCQKVPCPECPFTRGPQAVRLSSSRVREIAGNMLSTAGGPFPCHKGLQYDDETGEAIQDGTEPHCTGALIFAERHGTATQWMRIMERLGHYKAGDLRGQETVFDTKAEMLATALDRKGRRRR